jgi:hypothetical protein
MKTQIIKGASIEQKRAILANNKGQFFSCEWIAKDGQPRERQLREWMNKALVYGKDNVQVNPAAHNPDNFTAADVDKVAAGNPYPWVNVSLKGLRKAKVGGVEYTFED